MSQKTSESETSTELPPIVIAGRTLVLCFDGTTEQYSGSASYFTLAAVLWLNLCGAGHESRQIFRFAEEGRLQGATLLLPGL
jgi:uncharacterized protein (DUF2235 family)